DVTPTPPRKPTARPQPRRAPAATSARRPQARRPAAAPKPSSEWPARLGRYARLVRADRPIGFLLLLWPTLWGLWLAAKGFPPFPILLIFIAGVWLTRSAGCVVNDLA